MRILQPEYEIWEQAPGLEGVYKQVERAGRVCYKSEDHAGTGSAKPFVERMVKNEHTAMLEHATCCLCAPHGVLTDRYAGNRFSIVNVKDGRDYVTTNLRVLAQLDAMDDLKYLADWDENFERRITVHFTTQIAISREFNRHRVNSIAEQSTRYCNYSKNKFGSEIGVNLPSWVREDSGYSRENEYNDHTFDNMLRDLEGGKAEDWSKFEIWLFANAAAEYSYMRLIQQGCKPQEARVILPLDTNTELVHTAFVKDWKHFFDLRALGTTGAPHPDAKAIALPLFEEFKKRGYLS